MFLTEKQLKNQAIYAPFKPIEKFVNVPEVHQVNVDKAWSFITGLCRPEWLSTWRDCPHRTLIDLVLGNRKSLVLLFRGGGKSEFLSMLFLWIAIYHPEEAVEICCYTKENSIELVRVLWEICIRPHFTAVFPNLVKRYTREGGILFNRRMGIRKERNIVPTAVTSKETGGHFDYSLLSDVHDFWNARTEYQRKSILDWEESTHLPMLRTCKIYCIEGTRYDRNDLYGVKLGVSVREIREGQIKPKIATNIDTWNCFDENGKSIWESLISTEELLLKKAEVSSAAFRSQYQQDPSGFIGLRCKAEWIQPYNEDIAFETSVLSVDPAISEDGDFTVISRIGRFEGRYYIDVVNRGHWTQNKMILEIGEMYARYKPDNVLVESVAAQEWLAQEIIRRLGIPVKSIKKRKNKEETWREQEAFWENGQVFIRSTLQDAVDELLAFPEGAHDDIVDTITQGILYLRQEKPKVKSVYIPPMGQRHKGVLGI